MRPWRPRIRTVLLVVNLVILLLPLAGIQVLRLYENELVRQTEGALLTNGAYLREHFKAELLASLQRAAPKAAGATPLQPATASAPYGLRVAPQFEERPPSPEEPFDPLVARLDVARESIRPLAEEGLAPGRAPDPHAVEAGRRLSELLQRSQRHTLFGVRVVDVHGIVVASSRGEVGLSLRHREEVGRALAGERVSLLRQRVIEHPDPPLPAISRSNRVRIFVALPVVHANRVLGAVVLSRTPLELRKALYQDRFVLVRYGVGLLVIVLLVSALTATTISRPIEGLTAQADRVREGKPAEPIHRPGSHEVERLSEAIALMARTLHERSAYITTFVRNVSHEFKAPLATIQGTVELLRDHLETMSPDQRERFLGMIDSEGQRMERLVTRLLLLAQADTQRPGEGRTAVVRAASSIVEGFRRTGLDVTLASPDGAADLAVQVAPEAFESLLANLLENAKQHGGRDVHVVVRVERVATASGLTARLEVADDGRGISSANQARVFDAFFTTARESGGTGLGLSIVRSLAESHGGSARIASGGEGRGVTVTVELPAHPQRLEVR